MFERISFNISVHNFHVRSFVKAIDTDPFAFVILC